MADVGTMIATLGVTTKGIQESQQKMLGMLRTVGTQVDTLNAKLGMLGANAGPRVAAGVAAASGPLNRLGNEVGRVDNAFNKFSKGTAQVALRLRTVGYLMSATVTMPVIAAGKAIFNAAKDFEFSMQKMVGLAEVPQDQVEAWKKSLLELGPQVAKSPKELAEALYFISSSGISGARALDVLAISAKAATAGLGETQEVADLLTSVLNAYKGTGLTAARAADILVAAVREGKGEADAFARSMGQIVPIAANLGVSFDQVAGGMAAITLTGASAQNAAVYLKGFFNVLQKSPPEGEKALKSLGSSYTELRDIMNSGPTGLIDAMEHLRKISEQSPEPEEFLSDVIPNIRGLTAQLSIAGKNFKYNSEIMNQITNSAGALALAVKGVSDTLKIRLDQALSSVQASMIKLGEAIGPTVINFLEGLAKKLEKVAAKWNSLTEEQKKFRIEIAALAAVVGPASLAISALLYGVMGLSNALLGLKKVFTWLFASKVAIKGFWGIFGSGAAKAATTAAGTGMAVKGLTGYLSSSSGAMVQWGAASSTALGGASAAAASSVPAWAAMAAGISIAAAQLTIFLSVFKAWRGKMKEMKSYMADMQDALDFTDPIDKMRNEFYEKSWFETDKVVATAKDPFSGMTKDFKLSIRVWDSMTLDQLNDQKQKVDEIIALEKDKVKELKKEGDKRVKQEWDVQSRINRIREIDEKLEKGRTLRTRTPYTPGIIPKIGNDPSKKDMRLQQEKFYLQQEITQGYWEQFGATQVLISSLETKIKYDEESSNTLKGLITQEFKLTEAQQRRMEISEEIADVYASIASSQSAALKLESVLGDRYDYNSEILEIYRNGLEALAETEEKFTSSRARELIKKLNDAEFAMQDLTHSTKQLKKELDSALSTNLMQKDLFGFDFDLAQEDLNSYRGAIENLVKNIQKSLTINPFQMFDLGSNPDMVYALWLLAEYRKQYELTKKTMEAAADQKTLRFLQAQADEFKGMENQLELYNGQLQIAERQLRDIGEREGLSESFKKQAATVNTLRQAMKDLQDVMKMLVSEDAFAAFQTSSSYIDLLNTRISILNDQMRDLSLNMDINADDKVKQLKELAKATEELIIQRDMIDSFTGALTDLFSVGRDDFENFGDFINDWIKDLSKSIQRVLAKTLAEKLVGALLTAVKGKDKTTETLMGKLRAMFGESEVADTASALASSRALGQAKAYEALATAVAEAAKMGYPALLVSVPTAAAMVLGTLATGAAASSAATAAGTKMATGGKIPPGYPNDTFPAMLTSGEVVIPKDKVKSPEYVAEILDFPRFAEGLGELQFGPNQLMKFYQKLMKSFALPESQGYRMDFSIANPKDKSPYLLKQSPEQQKVAQDILEKGKQGGYLTKERFFDLVDDPKAFHTMLNKLPAVGGLAAGGLALPALMGGNQASAASRFGVDFSNLPTSEKEVQNNYWKEYEKTGSAQSLDTRSPEYAALFNSGRLAGYNPKTGDYSAPMLPEISVTAERKKNWGTYLAEEYGERNKNKTWADANILGGMFSPFMAAMQAPQLAMMQGITGEAQLPSEALKWGGVKGFAADMLIDPLNIPIAGMAKSLMKIPKVNISSIGKTLKNMPGVGVDAPELGYHALNKEHWALHPDRLIKEYTDVGAKPPSKKELSMLYLYAAGNRLTPLIKKTPFGHLEKKMAERVMKYDPYRLRESKDVWKALTDKKSLSYNGTFRPESDPTGRDLFKLFLYGDEKGFEKVPATLEGIDIGKRYKDLYGDVNRYFLKSDIPHGTPVTSQSADVLGEPWMGTRSYYEGVENFVQPVDDIGGHLQKITELSRNKLLAITQDFYKFNPVDYINRLESDDTISTVTDFLKLQAEKQAGIVDKLGKPFYLLQHNPIAPDLVPGYQQILKERKGIKPIVKVLDQSENLIKDYIPMDNKSIIERNQTEKDYWDQFVHGSRILGGKKNSFGFNASVNTVTGEAQYWNAERQKYLIIPPEWVSKMKDIKQADAISTLNQHADLFKTQAEAGTIIKPKASTMLSPNASTVGEMMGEEFRVSSKAKYPTYPVTPTMIDLADKSTGEATEWLKNWYGSPITQKKMNSINESLQTSPTWEGEQTWVEYWMENVLNKLYKSKAHFGDPSVFQSSLVKSTNDIAGISGYNLTGYSGRENLVNPFVIPERWWSDPRFHRNIKTRLSSTGVHEGTHGIADSFTFNRPEYRTLPNVFEDREFSQIMSDMMWKPEELPEWVAQYAKPHTWAAQNYRTLEHFAGGSEAGVKYFNEPGEIYARMNELRYGHEMKPGDILKPGQEWEDIMMAGAHEGYNISGIFFELIKKPELFRDLLNRMPAIAGGMTLGATTLGASQFNDNTPKLAAGGTIPPGYPNDTYPAMLTSGEAVLPAALWKLLEEKARQAKEGQFAKDPIVQEMTRAQQGWDSYHNARTLYHTILEGIEQPITVDKDNYFNIKDIENGKAGIRHNTPVNKQLLTDLSAAAAKEQVPLMDALTTALRETGIGGSTMMGSPVQWGGYYVPSEIMQGWSTESMKEMPADWDQFRLKNNFVDPQYVSKSFRGYSIYEPEDVVYKEIIKHGGKYLEYLQSFDIDPIMYEPFRKEMRFLKQNLGQKYNPGEKDRAEKMAREREVIFKNKDLYNFADSVYRANSPKIAGFQHGGVVPEGFPNDTFPAMLTSGESVIPRENLTVFVDLTKELAKLISSIDLLGGVLDTSPMRPTTNISSSSSQSGVRGVPEIVTPTQEANKILEEYNKNLQKTGEAKGNLENVSSAFGTLAQFTEGSTQSWMGYISSVTGSLPGVISSMNALTQAKKTQEAASIASAGAAAVENATQYPGPLMLVMLAVNVAALIASLAAVPKLAKGGIIPPGYKNDTFPAMLSSGEAVIPLNKLQNVNESSGSNTVEFRIKGDDLVGIHDKRKKVRSKF